MKIIKISVDNEISVYPFPTGTINEENHALNEMIGNYCSLYEHVMPRRLYTELGAVANVTNIDGEAVAMLVDEEGGLKENSLNIVASFLYESDRHGHPIMGNVLLVGKKWEGSGVSFCGIADKEFADLYSKLDSLVKRVREAGDK